MFTSNNNQLVPLSLAVALAFVIQLMAWLDSAECLIVTSVIAGDKKFKTISFDSKFLPALKFEKPLLLPTEFRRHRTLRPPKFDIDVNIPIKLPMEEEYPQEDDYQNKKPIESNFFFQTTDVQDDSHSYAKKKPQYGAGNAQKLYAAASNDYQQEQPVSDNQHHQHQQQQQQQHHHHHQQHQQHQQQQQADNNPKSIQDILQRPEDKASNKFSDGIDGAADSTKVNSVSTTNNNQQSIVAPLTQRSPDRRQYHREQMPSLLPLLNNLKSIHRARSLFQHHDQIDSRSSQDSNYPDDKSMTNSYATDGTSSSYGQTSGATGNSGQDQTGLESAIGYQPSSYQPSSSSSSYTSGDSNSPSPTSTYQHMGTQYYTRPGYMHHFQNQHTQLGSGAAQGDSSQDTTSYSGMTNQQTSNMDQDYLSTQMTSNQNQQQQYANNIEQQQQQQQQQPQSHYSPQQQAALINAYIMQQHHQQQQQQQQQLQSGSNKQQQQQQSVYMYPGHSTNSATYSSQHQQQLQDSQQPQSMPSELQPMVASSNDQQSQNSDNSQSTSNNQNDLQSAQTQQQQYDNNNQVANLQQAESHNDYQQQQQKQQYGNNNQQYYQQEFVPGGYINLQLKGPEGGPKMTYADYDRERWAQQVSQATAAMPNHVLNYQQLQNYYGGLGTFTNGLSDRYVGPMGILDKLKSSLHTLTSKLHLG